jgi:hypothetical protein
LPAVADLEPAAVGGGGGLQVAAVGADDEVTTAHGSSTAQAST